MILDPVLRKLNTIVLVNKITTKLKVELLEKTVCGVPMIEMIGMRICCYILLTVMIIRILGD